MFYCIIVPLAWLVWHIAFRIRVVGREHLIQGRGFVLAPNHISAIDPVFVVLARFWGRRMIVLGKEELFEVNPFVTWFLRHVGVVPVHRGKGDTAVVQQAIRQVQAGQGALIFPEGTRSKDGEIHRFKAGAFTLAKEAGAEILPVVLDGTKTLIKKNLAFNWGNRITVRVLPPVPAERVAALETHELMQEVHERMCTALGEVRNEKLKVKDQK